MNLENVHNKIQARSNGGGVQFLMGSTEGLFPLSVSLGLAGRQIDQQPPRCPRKNPLGSGWVSTGFVLGFRASHQLIPTDSLPR